MVAILHCPQINLVFLFALVVSYAGCTTRKPEDIKWNYTFQKLVEIGEISERVSSAGVDFKTVNSLQSVLEMADSKAGMHELRGSAQRYLIDEWGREFLWLQGIENGDVVVVVSSQGRLEPGSSLQSSPILRMVQTRDGKLIREMFCSSHR